MINIDDYRKSNIYKAVDFGDEAAKVTISKLVYHPIHFHEYLEIVFVIKGSVTVKSSSREFVLIENEFTLINAYEFHSLKRIADETTVVYIHIKQFGADDPLLLTDTGILKRDSKLYQTIKRNIIDVVKASSKKRGKTLLLKNCVNDIATNLSSNAKLAMYKLLGDENEYRSRNYYIERINDITDYLYCHFDEPLSLEETAKKFGLSKYYLSHILKKGYNKTFTEILRIVRIDRSEILVLDTDLSMSEICFLVGFISQQYFTKCFKEYYGLTPLQYRKKYQNETIKYKAFDEEVCDLEEFDRRNIDNTNNVQRQRPNILINLESGAYRINILKDVGDVIETDAANIKNNSSFEIDCDCDTMTIVIKKKQ